MSNGKRIGNIILGWRRDNCEWFQFSWLPSIRFCLQYNHDWWSPNNQSLKKGYSKSHLFTLNTPFQSSTISLPTLDIIEIFNYPKAPNFRSFTINGKAVNINVQKSTYSGITKTLYISTVGLIDLTSSDSIVLQWSNAGSSVFDISSAVGPDAGKMKALNTNRYDELYFWMIFLFPIVYVTAWSSIKVSIFILFNIKKSHFQVAINHSQGFYEHWLVVLNHRIWTISNMKQKSKTKRRKNKLDRHTMGIQ